MIDRDEKLNRRIDIMFKWIIATAVALPFILAVPAMAQDKAAEKAAKMIKKLDKDGDDKVSEAEFKALAKGDADKEAKVLKKFKKLDANSDGFLTKEEIAKGGKKKKEPKKKKKDDDAAK